MTATSKHLRTVASGPLADALAEVLGHPTGMSSAGYPFLSEPAYRALRDRVPQLLGWGVAGVAGRE